MSVVLCFFSNNEREGTIPVNTYQSSYTAENYFQEIVFHLAGILQKFVNEPQDVTNFQSLFWFAEKENFDFEEKESYGYVYAELFADDNIQLPDDAYEAAHLIAKFFVTSYVWESEMSAGKYTPTGYTVNDIPDVAPNISYDTPTDPRYNVGEVLVCKNGKTFTYAGVLHNPLQSYVSKQSEIVNTKGQPSYYGQKVLVGVECNDYVKEKIILDYLANGNIEIYPLPSIAILNLDKGMKWFARDSENIKLEGYGKTQKEAKNQLAIEVAFK